MVAILNIAQLKKMLNMPKVASSWFFISRVYSTRKCKKTSVMSQNEVELKKGTFPLNYNYCSLKPLCSGMGEVVPARTSPILLPPSSRTVLWLSCFKVLQCINCRDWHFKS